MGVQKNMAETLRLYMTEKDKTLLEFADDLQIARSSLQQYLKGEGNPSVRTIEQMARRMGIEPADLLGGVYDKDEHAYALLSTLQIVMALPKEKQLRFVELFSEILQLWSDG